MKRLTYKQHRWRVYRRCRKWGMAPETAEGIANALSPKAEGLPWRIVALALVYRLTGGDGNGADSPQEGMLWQRREVAARPLIGA